MNEPKWILADIANAIHTMLLAEHGGGEGIRDNELLDRKQSGANSLPLEGR